MHTHCHFHRHAHIHLISRLLNLQNLNFDLMHNWRSNYIYGNITNDNVNSSYTLRPLSLVPLTLYLSYVHFDCTWILLIYIIPFSRLYMMVLWNLTSMSQIKKNDKTNLNKIRLFRCRFFGISCCVRAVIYKNLNHTFCNNI